MVKLLKAQRKTSQVLNNLRGFSLSVIVKLTTYCLELLAGWFFKNRHINSWVQFD